MDIRRTLLLLALLSMSLPTVPALTIDSSWVINTTAFNSSYHFNETATFSRAYFDRGAVQFLGPDGTANWNISTALNLSMRNLNVSEALNVTLQQLKWDNTTATVKAVVRGFQPDRTVIVTRPDGTTQNIETGMSGTTVTLSWTGTTNQTKFTFNYTSQNLGTPQGGAGGGGGGGPPGTPEPLEKVKEAIKGAVANLTAPKASILYITQDTTACWVHKLSEILPPDSSDSYDPCFPGQLYSGQYTEVGAFAYMTNGSVLSYTWWISTPDLKVQPMKSTLTVPLGEGVYPVGVDVATSTGQVYSLNRTVNVVPGLPPVKAGGAVVGEAVSNTGRASFSVVGGVLGVAGGAASSGMASGDDWGKVIWTNGKASVTKGQLALLLFGGLGYIYFNGRGGKRRR